MDLTLAITTGNVSSGTVPVGTVQVGTVPVGSIPHILFSNKVFIADYQKWREKYSQFNPLDMECDPKKIVSFMEKWHDREEQEFLEDAEDKVFGEILALSLRWKNGVQVLSVAEIDEFVEALIGENIYAQTFYVMDGELCLETIHSFGTDYCMFREWKSSVSEMEYETTVMAIIRGADHAETMLDACTYRIGQNFMPKKPTLTVLK